MKHLDNPMYNGKLRYSLFGQMERGNGWYTIKTGISFSELEAEIDHQSTMWRYLELGSYIVGEDKIFYNILTECRLRVK